MRTSGTSAVAGDLAEEELLKECTVMVGKPFTTHHLLIADRLGAVKEERLPEIPGRQQTLFAGDRGPARTGPKAPGGTRD